MSDFDWKEIDREDLIAREVRDTAVYWNPDGDIVIRQRGDAFDEDAVVIVPQDRVRAMIARLTALLAELD